MAALTSKWWLIAGAAALGALLVLAVGRLDSTATSTATSSIRVGLSTATEWPDYQPTIDSFGNIAASDDIRTSVEDILGEPIERVEVEPLVGGFVVDIRVEAASEELAIQAAEQLARTSISRQTELASGGSDQEFSALAIEIEQLALSIEETAAANRQLRDRASVLGAALDQEFSFEAEAVFRETLTEADLLDNVVTDSERRLRQLQQRQSDIELDAVQGAEDLYIVRNAEIVSSSGPVTDQTVSIVAGAVAAALGAAAFVVVSDRTRGPVRNAEQVERVIGRPVVGHMVGEVDSYGGRGLRRAVNAVGRRSTIEVIVDEDLSADGAAVSAALNSICTDDDEETHPVFVHEPSTRPDAVLIVAETGWSSMQSLRKDIRDHELAEAAIVGVLLT